MGSSRLLLRHPDCPVRFEPLQQEPDRACAPCGGLWHSRGEGQQGHSTLERPKRLQPKPRPRQVQIHLCAAVQCSRYGILPFARTAWGLPPYLLLTEAVAGSICSPLERMMSCVSYHHRRRILALVVHGRYPIYSTLDTWYWLNKQHTFILIYSLIWFWNAAEMSLVSTIQSMISSLWHNCSCCIQFLS